MKELLVGLQIMALAAFVSYGTATVADRVLNLGLAEGLLAILLIVVGIGFIAHAIGEMVLGE